MPYHPCLIPSLSDSSSSMWRGVRILHDDVLVVIVECSVVVWKVLSRRWSGEALLWEACNLLPRIIPMVAKEATDMSLEVGCRLQLPDGIGVVGQVPLDLHRESFPPHDHCNAETSQRSLVFARSVVDVVRRWQRVVDMTCQPLFVRGQGRKIPLQAVQFPGCAGRRRGLGETRILGCAHSILSCPGHAIRLSLPERATQVRSLRRMGEKTGKCAQRGSRPPVAALPTMART